MIVYENRTETLSGTGTGNASVLPFNQAAQSHCALYLRSTLITSCAAEPRAMLLSRPRTRKIGSRG